MIKKSHINKALITLLLISGGVLLVLLGFQYTISVLIGEKPDQNTITLYYHKTQGSQLLCDVLYPINNIIAQDDRKIATVVNRVMQGPSVIAQSQGYISFFSRQTESSVRSIRTEGTTAYIDLYDVRSLENNVNKKLQGCGKDTYFEPVTKTLKSNFDIKKVIYAIQGNTKTYAEWIGKWCGPWDINCKNDKFSPADQTTKTTRIKSLSEKVSFSNPQEWYIQQDSPFEQDFDDNFLITKTSISNIPLEKINPEQNNEVLLTIIEKKDNKDQITLECESLENITCSDTTISGLPAKMKKTVTDEKTIEELTVKKDNLLYIIVLRNPYPTTANKEYDISHKIIESITID